MLTNGVSVCLAFRGISHTTLAACCMLIFFGPFVRGSHTATLSSHRLDWTLIERPAFRSHRMLPGQSSHCHFAHWTDCYFYCLVSVFCLHCSCNRAVYVCGLMCSDGYFCVFYWHLFDPARLQTSRNCDALTFAATVVQIYIKSEIAYQLKLHQLLRLPLARPLCALHSPFTHLIGIDCLFNIALSTDRVVWCSFFVCTVHPAPLAPPARASSSQHCCSLCARTAAVRLPPSNMRLRRYLSENSLSITFVNKIKAIKT